jgi:hypothetical protein
MTQSTDDRALLIKKLLNKAEAQGTTPEERDALTAKATQLMIKWGIEEALVHQADRVAEERIVSETIEHQGLKTYSYEYTLIGISVARAFGATGLLSRGRGGRTNLSLIGFESDVAAIKMIFHSLVLQCTLNLGSFAKQEIKPWHSGTDRFQIRRGFIAGFATGVGKKLTDARKAAVEETGASGALVLVDRSKKVDEWVSTHMRLANGRGRAYESSARGAGFAAGQRADVGGTKVGGGQREIGS